MTCYCARLDHELLYCNEKPMAFRWSIGPTLENRWPVARATTDNLIDLMARHKIPGVMTKINLHANQVRP